jgi:hypothetical protein
MNACDGNIERFRELWIAPIIAIWESAQLVPSTVGRPTATASAVYKAAVSAQYLYHLLSLTTTSLYARSKTANNSLCLLQFNVH